MTDIIERLKQVRGALGETQKNMSTRLGMSENTWQSYERGLGVPKFETLEKLAELGFNPNWIVTGKGPMREGDASAPTKSEHQPDDTISKKIAYNVIIALAPHFGITREPAQDELAELFLDLCDYLKEGSDSAPSQVIDFGMHRVRRSQAG